MQNKPRIQTIADQQAEARRLATPSPEWLAQEEARIAAQQQAAAQAAAQQQGQPGAFPGSAPGAPSNGLLGDTMRAIGDFFAPDKPLGEMVPASQNPLMSAPGVGIGGEMRRKQIEEQERQATQGQAQRRR